MSISSVGGVSPMAQSQRSATASTQSNTSATQGASSTPFSLGFDASAGIEVNLPNGMSVGVFSISPGANPFAGASGASSSSALAQMISSVEQMVAAFENSVPTSSTSGGSAASDSSAAANAAAAASPGSSIQGMTASMPNGISVEVFQAEQGSGTSDGGDASSNQMVSTIEQLVAALDKYPAPGASAGTAASTSSGGSVNAVA
jgi:hypothetical protein